MQIMKIEALENGAHRNQKGKFTTIPEGWAKIPDDMIIPASFPVVDVEIGEETEYTEVPCVKDVVITREKTVYDENGELVLDKDGNAVTITEECNKKVIVVVKVPRTIKVVTSMNAGIGTESISTTEETTDDLGGGEID